MSLTISIDFAASIARLEEQSKKAATAVQQMAEQVDGAASFAREALLGLAGAVSVAGFAAATREAINYADSLNDLAVRTGTTVEMLAGLRLAAQLSDTSMESLATGARKLATGLVENREAFQSLGINTKSQTEALIQLGDVFAGMPDPVQRSALAVRVFGKSGEDLIPLLMNGSEGIRSMVQQGQELAGVTTQMAARAAVFNDNMDILRLKSQGVFLTIGDQLLPVLNETVTALNGVNTEGGVTETVGNGIAVVFETIVVLGAEVAYMFNAVGREIGGMAAQVTALASGDWEGFKAIGREMKADAESARQGIDEFTKKVLTARERAKEEAKKAEGGANKGSTDNRGAQLLQSLSGASDEFAKMRQKDIDGWVRYADAVLAESEAIEAMQRDRLIKDNEAAAASELAWQQGVAQRLAALQTAALSEVEIERGKLTAIQNDLQFARDMGILSEADHHKLLEDAQLQHQARMGNIMAQGQIWHQNISKKSWDGQVKGYAGMFRELTNTAATSNKAMFEINKIAGISEAVINTYRSATGAYAALAPIPIVGPALGAAAAGVAIAAGLANVNAIRSAQFGSSTSAPSIAGGNAIPVFNAGGTSMQSTPVPEQTRPRQQMDLTLVGDAFTYDTVATVLIPRINEAAENGVDIVVRRG
ncbi:MAG: hypothetical protein ACK5QH_08775 [Rubrivivax sp.]